MAMSKLLSFFSKKKKRKKKKKKKKKKEKKRAHRVENTMTGMAHFSP
jgi:hypothetical protein